MHSRQFDAPMVLSPVLPVGSPWSLLLLTGIVSAFAPMALISLLLRSQRK